MKQEEKNTLEWRFSKMPEDYLNSVNLMEERVGAIRDGTAPELIWFLEHPALYTAGTSAKADDLLDAARFPVYVTGRGGEYTYHGPGQRVVYVMLDLKKRELDVRAYVRSLEEWIIRSLASLGVESGRREGRVGIWVDRGNGREDKIAALGVRVRRWVSFHGIAINLSPDLAHYTGIVPCGIAAHGVTSLEDFGVKTDMQELDAALTNSFDEVF